MRKKQAAFTLVEAIVAMGILSMVLVMVYQTFYSVLRVTEVGTDAAEQVQRERIVLKTIEDALSGIVYYEQNQEHYAFVADTLDFEHPAISFVSRVPPDFLGSKEFGAQGLRRIDFVVEDGETLEDRSLVMYQTPILQPVDVSELEDPKRWVLGPGLDTFMVMFWSTKDLIWMPDWEETNSVPARLRIEMAFKLNDGSSPKHTETHKREIVIFSDTITQAMQNPRMPASRSSRSSRGRPSGGRNSGPRKPSAEDLAKIAAHRRNREEEAKKRGSSSERNKSSSGRKISDFPKSWQNAARKYDTNGDGKIDSAEGAKWRADAAAQRLAKAASGGSKGTAGGGTGAGSNGTGAGSNGTGTGGGDGTGTGGGGRGTTGGGGGISILPGALVLNDDLAEYKRVYGEDAQTLQDLVDGGFYDSMEALQATAPPGAEWEIDPDTGAVVPIYP